VHRVPRFVPTDHPHLVAAASRLNRTLRIWALVLIGMGVLAFWGSKASCRMSAALWLGPCTAFSPTLPLGPALIDVFLGTVAIMAGIATAAAAMKDRGGEGVEDMGDGGSFAPHPPGIPSPPPARFPCPRQVSGRRMGILGRNA